MCNSTPSTPAGLDQISYSIESAAQALGISATRTQKLRSLKLLARRSDSGVAGWDVAYLASARQRALPLSGPQLVCSMGVEPDTPGRPNMLFTRDQNQGYDILQVVEDIMWPEGDKETAGLREAFLDGRIGVTGFWRVSEDNASSLVNQQGLILASYTGFILDGGRVIAEVPELAKTVNETIADASYRGRAFIVAPLQPKDQDRHLHTYREPLTGPVVEYLDR